MRSSVGSALLAGTLAVLLATSVAVIAAPPPTTLCATCDSGLEGATDRGTLDIYLEDDGDSRWVERTPVEPAAADRYADGDELERAVEESGNYYGHVAADDRENLSAALEDETVVVTYRVEDVATAGVGDAWVVDYFYAGGTATRYHASAERVTLHPPDRTAVRTHPSEATLEDGVLTWEGGDPGRRGSDFDPRTLVTYGPDGASTTAAAHATVATTLGPQTAHHAVMGGLVPAFVVGAAVLASAHTGRVIATRSIRRRASRLGREHLGIDRLEGAIVVAGLTGVVVALLGVALGDEVTATNAVALGAGAGTYAALGALLRRVRDPDARVLCAIAIAGAVGCAAILLGLSRSLTALAPAALALSAFAFLPLGYIIERRAAGWLGACLALVLVGPFAAVAVFAPMYVFGLPPVFHGLLFVPAALLVAAAGYPLSVVGRRLADRSR